jgi:hypothetical protein
MTNIDVTKVDWGDVELRSLAWIEDGRDLAFHVRMPGSEPPSDGDRVIVCRWAHGLVVNLTYRLGHGGFPFTWAATFTQGSDRVWSIEFDFAGEGEIHLKCNEVEVIDAPR